MQLTPDQRRTFLSRLRAALPVARWFRGKARSLAGLHVAADAPVPLGDGTTAHFLLVRAEYRSGEPEHYFVPLLTPGLGEALQSAAFRSTLLRLIVRGESIPTEGGRLAGRAGQAAAGASLKLASEALALEQSNSAIAYGDQFFLKVFRAPEVGENPDIELGSYLTEEVAFPNAPVFAGTLTLDIGEAEPRVLALMQRRIEALGDAWPLACALAGGDLRAGISRASRESLQLAAELGLRTAEMHAALAQGKSSTLAPEPFGLPEYEALQARAAKRCAETAELLERKGGSPALVAALQARSQPAGISRRLRLGGSLIRIHGDYHLGQVLVRSDGALIITDFEGEPARPLSERRQKRGPLVDVAGMLRSFDYAAATAVREAGDEETDAGGWREAMGRRFLQRYFATLPPALLPPKAARTAVLESLLLEKAAYELAYELNNRPDWVAIPQGGLERILKVG